MNFQNKQLHRLPISLSFLKLTVVGTAILCSAAAHASDKKSVFVPDKKAFNKIRFTKNLGQLIDQHNVPRHDILYYVNSESIRLFMKSDGISYEMLRSSAGDSEEPNIETSRVDFQWIDGNPKPEISTGDMFSEFDNFYLEHCPEGLLRVPSFSDVIYHNVFDDIDIKWYNKQDLLEYDFVIHPNGNVKDIRWKVRGAESISIAENGDLKIVTSLGTIVESKPVAFQNNRPIDVFWHVHDSIVSFRVGSYDPSQILVIDPIVQIWGSYYGGIGDDRITSSTMDQNGAIYVSGHTNSLNHIATSGSHQNTFGGTSPLQDAYLARFDTNGTRIWATYYGGTGSDIGNDCAVSNSAVYLCGSTISNNAISTSGTHQTAFGGGSHDGFLAKFDFSGARQWGTYFGGDEYDIIIGCAANDSLVYVVGRTESDTLISTSGSYQTSRAGNEDAFIARIDSGGTMVWSSYYGDLADDLGVDCAIDQAASVYFCGTTYSSSTSFSSSGSHQTTNGGFSDGFLVKFDVTGSRLWASYYGGSGSDGAIECEVDDSSYVYLVGHSSSSNAIATSGVHQPSSGGSTDAFVAKFSAAGTRVWATYYGGSGADRGYDCAIDQNGSVYLTGYVTSPSGIATTGSHQTVYGGNNDGFVAKFNAGGSRDWGTYVGGSDIDRGNTCLVDASYNVFLFGETKSSDDISTFGSHQDSLNGNFDGFLSLFFDCNLPEIDSVLGSEICDSGMITLYASATFGDLEWFEDSLGGNSISADSLLITPMLNSTKTYYVSAADGKCKSERVEVTAIVNYSSDTSLIDSACYVYTSPKGNVYTASGIYIDTISNHLGCDSVIEIDLTIKTIDTQVQQSGNQLTANTGPAGYQWIECSSGPINGANAQSFTVTSNGSYAVIITQNGCVDTSACFDFTNVGTGDIAGDQHNINLYPNPASNFLQVDFGEKILHGEVCLKDLSGKHIRCWQVEKQREKTIQLNYPSGMYVLIFTVNDWIKTMPLSIR